MARSGMVLICILGIAAVSRSSSSSRFAPRYWSMDAIVQREQTREELKRLDFHKTLSIETMNSLFEYQAQTGFTLATILRDRVWAQKLGLTSSQYQGTWYASNPFELLPSELQTAITNKKTSFMTRDQVWKWIKTNHFPVTWKENLKNAFIETTPENLWRAGQGLRPYAKNGEFLQPIVFQKGGNEFDVRDGHIATDPSVIPTNSEVFVILRIQGIDRIVRVKATDIGGAIKGKHVDLPVHLNSAPQESPYIIFPHQISNPTVTILAPVS